MPPWPTQNWSTNTLLHRKMGHDQTVWSSYAPVASWVGVFHNLEDALRALSSAKISQRDKASMDTSFLSCSTYLDTLIFNATFLASCISILCACVVGSLPSTPPCSMSTLDNSHQSRNWYCPLPLDGTSSLEQCVHPPSRVCCLGLHLSRQTNELGLISGIYIQGNQTWLIFRSNTRSEVWVRTLLVFHLNT